MRILFFVLIFITASFSFAQEKEFVDASYYEDQFYAGIQYNALLNTTSGIDNIGVPFSFETGFIKDIPFNKQRNIGMGIGIGYNYNILRPNIFINDNNGSIELSISNAISNSNYLSHNLEIPLEFRWRTSTATNHSFWRVYSGISFIYNLRNKTEITSNGSVLSFSNLDIFNQQNYTLNASLGHGTWNLRLKYSLRSPFKSNTQTIDNKSLSFNQLKIGIIFYLL